MKLAPKVYYVQVANFGRTSEAIQGYLRKIGVDWRLQPFDSTIAPAKMAEQDYEIWTVAVPYLSAGELMNLYFDSKNIPTPNRMNWQDPETDEWLRQGRAALTDADRAKYYMLVQKKVADEHLWIPVINAGMYLVTNKKLKGCPAAHALPEHLLQGTGLVSLEMESRTKSIVISGGVTSALKRSEGSHANCERRARSNAMTSFASLQRGGYPARDDGKARKRRCVIP